MDRIDELYIQNRKIELLETIIQKLKHIITEEWDSEKFKQSLELCIREYENIIKNEG